METISNRYETASRKSIELNHLIDSSGLKDQSTFPASDSNDTASQSGQDLTNIGTPNTPPSLSSSPPDQSSNPVDSSPDKSRIEREIEAEKKETERIEKEVQDKGLRIRELCTEAAVKDREKVDPLGVDSGVLLSCGWYGSEAR